MPVYSGPRGYTAPREQDVCHFYNKRTLNVVPGDLRRCCLPAPGGGSSRSPFGLPAASPCLCAQVPRPLSRCPPCLSPQNRFGRKPVLSWFCLLVAVTSISTVAAPSFPLYCGLRFLSALGLSSILLTSTMLSESLDCWPQPQCGDGVQWGRGGLRAHHTGPSPACLHRPSVVEWTMTSTRAITMVILGSTYSISQMAVGGLAFALQDWRTLQLAMSVPFFIIFLISWSVQCGAFSLGEKWEGNPRGCPSPLSLWLVMAPNMLRPSKRVM